MKKKHKLISRFKNIKMDSTSSDAVRIRTEKCEYAKEILREDALGMQDDNFLKLIDSNKLLKITGFDLNQIIVHSYFSLPERSSIRKMRRVLINRATAKKSGIKKNKEFLELKEVINDMKMESQTLRMEKYSLQLEIHELQAKMLGRN